MECTQEHESPELFHYWTALSVVGASMKRNVFLDRVFYTLFPNLYVIIVGASGIQRKSVSTGYGVRMLREAAGKTLTIIHDKATPEGLFDVMQTKRVDPNDPMSVIDDACLYVYASELGVFLGTSKYLTDLIPLLTTLYDGKDVSDYVTKTKGRFSIKNGILSILGCSTPDWIPRCMPDDAIGGGFISRFIFVASPGGKRVAWPVKTPRMAILEQDLQHDLYLMTSLQGGFDFTPQARQWFEDWYHNQKPILGDPKFDGYYSRKHDHIFKLAMIISSCRNEQYVIDTHHLEQAKASLDAVEPYMHKAFSNIGTTNQFNIGMKILQYMYRQGGKAKYAEILRHVTRYIHGSEELKDVMYMLAAQQYVRQVMAGSVSYWELMVDPNTI